MTVLRTGGEKLNHCDDPVYLDRRVTLARLASSLFLRFIVALIVRRLVKGIGKEAQIDAFGILPENTPSIKQGSLMLRRIKKRGISGPVEN